MKFKEWMQIKENLWGNIPVKTRKPSDGPPGASGAGMQAPAQAAMQPKMMKEKMKKKMEKKW